MGAPRLYAFDLEGTLTLHAHNKQHYPSDWPLLAESLGQACLDEENELSSRWNEQQKTSVPLVGSYVDYMRRTIEIHQKYGLTREIFDGVVASIPFIDGIEETFRRIKEHNDLNRIAVISGGFRNRAVLMPGVRHVDEIRTACNYVFDEGGRLTRWDLREYDYSGKVESLKEIAQQYGIRVPDDAYFVGDGRNDAKIMEAVGHPIALNAQPELAECVTRLGGPSLAASDLTQIIPHLNLSD